MFHDDDGKKYIVALEWETRTVYENRALLYVEYDPAQGKSSGMPKAFWRGGTDRGCLRHLIDKRGNYYYYCVLKAELDIITA